ncbi:CBS domain-containing protein [Streptomyces sp. NBC_00005]|uniref:CBS domain-containing protein n=1 Tax=Streptomyces sp. NBC_00005 TaxID=2903609 RepID=UPI00325561D4
MTAYRIMRDRQVLRVPVVDAGRLVGVVTFDDLFWPAAQELNDLADVVGRARDLTQPL